MDKFYSKPLVTFEDFGPMNFSKYVAHRVNFRVVLRIMTIYSLVDYILTKELTLSILTCKYIFALEKEFDIK